MRAATPTAPAITTASVSARSFGLLRESRQFLSTHRRRFSIYAFAKRIAAPGTVFHWRHFCWHYSASRPSSCCHLQCWAASGGCRAGYCGEIGCGGVPFFALSLLSGLITIWFQHHQVLQGSLVRSEGFFARLATAGWIPWFYLYKAFLPLNLTVVYPKVAGRSITLDFSRARGAAGRVFPGFLAETKDAGTSAPVRAGILRRDAFSGAGIFRSGFLCLFAGSGSLVILLHHRSHCRDGSGRQKPVWTDR